MTDHSDSDEGTEDNNERTRAVGRALRSIGEVLADDEKRARLEATIRDMRQRVERNPGLVLDIARELADRFGKRS